MKTVRPNNFLTCTQFYLTSKSIKMYLYYIRVIFSWRGGDRGLVSQIIFNIGLLLICYL